MKSGKPKSRNPAKVFISYKREGEDEGLKEELRAHLRPLERKGIIKIWDDAKILPGDTWEEKVVAKLEAADVILLLISAQFLNSEFCWDVEVKKAIERHKTGEAKAIPIILRPCDWKHEPLVQIQALPKDGKPVIEWKSKDSAFLDIVNGIKKMSVAFLKEKQRRAEAAKKQKAEAEAKRQQAEARRREEERREELFKRIETPSDGEVELFREIPAGEFLMGSPAGEEGRTSDEEPQHKVTVKSPFRLAVVPVTVAQYQDFNPGHRPYWEGRIPAEELPYLPVVGVSWNEILAFCGWLAETWSLHGARLRRSPPGCPPATRIPGWVAARTRGGRRGARSGGR